MIMPFDYYVREKLVIKNIPNISVAKSLFQKAGFRLKINRSAKIDENTASIIFEEVYESLREAAQALMELKGYKPYSHEVVISFIREHNFLSEEKSNIFDNYRVLRNNSVYKAEKISIEKCIEAMEFAKNTLPELNKIFEGMIRR